MNAQMNQQDMQQSASGKNKHFMQDAIEKKIEKFSS